MPAISQVTPALPTRDIRSASNDSKRSKSQAVKWSRGGRAAAGKDCDHRKDVAGPSCHECSARPYKNGAAEIASRLSRNSIYANNHGHRQENIARKGLSNDLNEVVSWPETGSESDSDASVDNADVMFSYDARRGPSDGADILGNAVMQAVERFENKQIEKLVKQEYDTLPDRRDFEEEPEDFSDEHDDEYDFISSKDLS